MKLSTQDKLQGWVMALFVGAVIATAYRLGDTGQPALWLIPMVAVAALGVNIIEGWGRVNLRKLITIETRESAIEAHFSSKGKKS